MGVPDVPRIGDPNANKAQRLVRRLAAPVTLPPDSAGDDVWERFADLMSFESEIAGRISSSSGGSRLPAHDVASWLDALDRRPEWVADWPDRVAELRAVLTELRSS